LLFQWGWCVAPESVPVGLVCCSGIGPSTRPSTPTRWNPERPRPAICRPTRLPKGVERPQRASLVGRCPPRGSAGWLTFITKSGAGVGRGEPAPVRTEGHARNWAPAFMPMKHLGERGVAVQQGEAADRASGTGATLTPSAARSRAKSGSVSPRSRAAKAAARPCAPQ
jgi:hypothetical protein